MVMRESPVKPLARTCAVHWEHKPPRCQVPSTNECAACGSLAGDLYRRLAEDIAFPLGLTRPLPSAESGAPRFSVTTSKNH